MLRRLITAFMRFFFDLLYHGLAGVYDLVADVVSLGHWRDWIAATLPLLTEEPLLELGHGPGHLQKTLLQSGRRVYALDESRQMSHLARRRLLGLPFRLARANARRLPFPPGIFPIVAATFPSEYIFHEQTLSEIWRVLTDDGRAVILLAASPEGPSLAEKAIRLLYRITGESASVEASFAKLTAMFSSKGFSPEYKYESCYHTRLLIIILTKVLPKLKN